jgi:mannose-6-phosphate isomerase-like protein (cupin superfamily)
VKALGFFGYSYELIAQSFLIRMDFMVECKPISSSDGGHHFVWGGDCDGWHLLAKKDLSIIHERMPANRAEERHFHAVARQFFFVLSGELTFVFEGYSKTVRQNEGIEIPANTIHSAQNIAAYDVQFLAISQPNTFTDRVDV